MVRESKCGLGVVGELSDGGFVVHKLIRFPKVHS